MAKSESKGIWGVLVKFTEYLERPNPYLDDACLLQSNEGCVPSGVQGQGTQVPFQGMFSQKVPLPIQQEKMMVQRPHQQSVTGKRLRDEPTGSRRGDFVFG